MSHTTVKLQRNTQPVRLARPIKTVTLARVAGGPKGDPGTDTSLLVAKGDVLTHDGVDAVRLGVGTDGQLLSAASGEVEGVDWIDPPAADPLTTAGDLLTHDGILSLRFPLGVGGQYLRVNAGATAIEWDTFDIINDLPAHASTHENGGTDEISVLGLSGLLADAQTPLAHAASHLPSGSDPLTTAIAGSILPDAAPAIGVAESFARSDHAHGFDTATPDALAVGAVAAEGSAINMVRRDHTHGVPAAAPGATINAGDAAVEGVATSFVRSDHQHAVATGVAVELTDSTNAEGVLTDLARSDHTHAHGARSGGTLHAVATAILAGFMSAADKAALDAHLIDFANPHQVTQQQTYDQASDITLTGAQGAVTITDNATPVGNLLEVRDNSPANVFDVDPTQMNFGTAAQRLFVADNVIAGYGGIEFYPDDFTRTTLAANNSAFSWTSTLTSSVPGGGGIGNENAPNFVSWGGEVILTEQGNLFNTQSLFNQATTVTCQGASTGPIYTMINQPLLRTGSSGGARTGSQQNAVRSQLRIGPNIAGTFTLASHEPYFATMLIDASGGAASVTTARYFAPKAPSLTGGATVGTLECLGIPDIPAAGITNLRGIASEMNSGEFVRHIGTAPAQLGGSLQLGLGSTFDWSISRAAANRADIATGDSLRLINGSLQFVGTGGQLASSVDGEIELTSTRLGFGIAPAAANWAFAFSATARTITVGGDFANCLNTAGGNHTIDAALSTFTQWTVNAPAGTIGSGSVVDAANMIIQTAPSIGTNRYGLLVTVNPSGGTINRCARFVGASGVQIDGELEHGGSTLGVLGAPPVTQAADPGALTDSTGGAANNTVVAVPPVNGSGATTAQEAAINDNFADLIDQINQLRAMLSEAAGGIGVSA